MGLTQVGHAGAGGRSIEPATVFSLSSLYGVDAWVCSASSGRSVVGLGASSSTYGAMATVAKSGLSMAGTSSAVDGSNAEGIVARLGGGGVAGLAATFAVVIVGGTGGGATEGAGERRGGGRVRSGLDRVTGEGSAPTEAVEPSAGTGITVRGLPGPLAACGAAGAATGMMTGVMTGGVNDAGSGAPNCGGA